MKYVKKPIPIEAIKLPFITDTLSVDEWENLLPNWFKEAIGLFIIPDEKFTGVYIRTLEGEMFATYGNYYIIRGPKGEIYPCRADVFEETYEVFNEKEENDNE